MELDSAKINELRFLLVNYAEPESVVRHAGSNRGNKNAFVMIKRLVSSGYVPLIQSLRAFHCLVIYSLIE